MPDLAIEPQHATITEHGGGRLSVEATGTLGFSLDGVETSQATIDRSGGGELGFGTYRITISADADDVLLTVRQVEDSATKSGDLEQKLGFSLAGVLPSKRVMSWALAAFILLSFLAVPIVSHVTRDVEAKQQVIGDSSWSSGDLSLAHHGLKDQCETCHVRAFESVRDETCKSCHTDLHDHADLTRLDAAHGSRPLGTKLLRSVAHAFGKEGPGACADCHTEHEGNRFMEPAPQAFCADCHGMLKENLPDTSLGEAVDFGSQHPQFAPAIITDSTIGKPVRVSLDRRPREDSGLTFPHKLHLRTKGGVARMAANIGSEAGYGAGGLQCKDCHRPTEDGIRFQKIDMERDCEACHSLTYDQVGGIFRKLRHGDVDQVIADLSAGDFRRQSISARRRPGDYAQGRPYHFNFSGAAWKGLKVGIALSKDGICGECHRPASRADGKIGVQPVTLVSRYMDHGWFDHAAHKQEDCTSCHAAPTSTSAKDLLLPGIKDCRQCHLGEDTVKAKVPSSCIMCHGYHMTGQGAVDTTDRKRNSRAKEQG
ncbi:MAG: cytochrome c3 family protein [Novosphingobium sp.]|nr:cytochrome c3 family protein [Novosphingobium sp.]